MSDWDSGLGGLEAQLASKEKEWQELLVARVHQLESLLKKAQGESSSLREHNRQLREDFQFNLAILDERDRELERYDAVTARVLMVKHNRQEELNQLHMQVAKLEEQRARETAERQEELGESRQYRLQLDQLKQLDMSLTLEELCAIAKVKYSRAVEAERRVSSSEEEDSLESEKDSTEDYVPDESENAEEQDEVDSSGGEGRLGRRRKKADPETWKINVQKRRRMKGQSYLGRRDKEPALKEARHMGMPCQSAACQRSSKLHCTQVVESKRKEIFKYFWEKLDWKERKIFVKSLVEVSSVKRQRTGADESRRSASIFCHLVVDGRRLRVCQRMFLSTLGIKQWCFLKWVGRRGKSPEQTERVDVRVRAGTEEQEFLKTFLLDLPKVPSHYCRSSSSKMYLEPVFKSISQLHTQYKRSCAEHGFQPLSRQVFSTIFHDLNLSLFHPKKDQCDTCCTFKAGNLDAATWEEHCIKKDTARAMKQKDKEEAGEKTLLVCMDLQGLLLCPKLQASALYYKTKLGVHNFTIFDMISHDATNYLWHEGEAGLSANEFASCVVHYLEAHPSYDEYILWSDGCGYQNRNLLLSNALLKFATEKQKPVTQKYLERGHTQMECDSVHSVIERRLRHREICVPAEYAAVIRGTCSNPRPYEVRYVNHAFFKDFRQVNLCKSIRPGKTAGDPTVHDLRAISSMAGEIQKQTEVFKRMKWDLQCRIQELEGELTLQRKEMTAAFDSELKQQQHEFNLKMDEMRTVVLSHDLKVKLLSREAEVHRQARLQATEALKASQEFCDQMKIQLQNKEQEATELTAVKDYRMKELEDKLKCMETKLKKEEENYINKYKDVIQALMKCDAQLKAQYQAQKDQLQKVEKHTVKLQKNMEVLAAKVHCIQSSQKEAMRQKDEMIQRLCTEVETTRTGWDKYITQVSSEMVVKDTEIITLQEREKKLWTEQERSKEEMEGYKQQLSAGLKRERALEQMRVQVELEWQRRCEDMKIDHYLANERLIQDLTQARDQAKAELKDKEQELQDLTVFLRSLKTERDQAIQGLTPKVDSLASEEIRRLQEQNSILRAVIAQMRKDMEGLSHLLPRTHPQTLASSLQTVHQGALAQITTGYPANISPADYTQALEQEVSQLKTRCRHLEGQLDGAVGLPSLAPATDKPTKNLTLRVPDNTNLQTEGLKHGGLHLEKHSITSALTEQEVRKAHIMEQRAQLQQENPCVRQQQGSSLMSSDLSENIQGAKNKPPVLHSRLKQAALCIARLSREKQQLIEMGNRLRGQITAAGLKGCFPDRDTSTDKAGDQHDRLSVLEQLQYQLTTQELQYALRQRAGTYAEQLLPGTNNRGPAIKGTANPWSQEHKISDRPESSTNKENTPLLSQSQSLLSLSKSLLSSEESLRSLNELWEILDHGLSPSIFSEGEGELSRGEVAKSGGAGVQMMVHGISAQLQTKVQQKKNPSTAPSITTKSSQPAALGRITKIRNYNNKD